MLFYDSDSESIVTIQNLHSEWKTGRIYEPENHLKSFSAEFLEIVLATINGRNNLEIIGYTTKEISRFVSKLKNRIIAEELNK